MAETQRTASNKTKPSAGSPPRDETAETEPRDVAKRAVEEARDVGSELLTAVRDSAASLADEQRERAVNEVHAVGGVLRSTVKSLDDAGGATFARYAEEAARQVDDFADRLKNRSWSELATDVEDFARRWPLAFIAAAFGAGFAIGRVLVSATPKKEEASMMPAGALSDQTNQPKPSAATGTAAPTSGATVGFAASGSREGR